MYGVYVLNPSAETLRAAMLLLREAYETQKRRSACGGGTKDEAAPA